MEEIFIRKNSLYIKALVVTLLIVVMFSGCIKSNKNESTFGLEDFKIAMKDIGYDFEIQDAGQDFLPTTRKRMVFDDKVLDIYIFDSDIEAETEAGYIEVDGFGYNNGKKGVKVSWISMPHFFKKGSIIVQYIGEDEDIINVLEDILGKAFAGVTSI